MLPVPSSMGRMEVADLTGKPDQLQGAQGAGKPEESRLSEKNSEALAWLREWMSTPDDMGEKWWAEFRRFLAANRLNLRRGE